MHIARAITGFSVLGIVAAMGVALEAAQGEDWKQFRGPGRLAATSESGWSTTWPAQGPPLLWQREVGSGNGTVVVGDG